MRRRNGWIGLVGLVVACGRGDPGPACEGGGTTSAVVGQLDQGTFTALSDGDPITVEDTSSGPAMRFDYEVTGLDTRSPITVVLRLGRNGGGTTDYLASAVLTCVEPGPASYGAYAGWPSDWPDPGTARGDSLQVRTVFTDVTGDSAEADVDLVVGPAR
jgi:hypothetical protein